MEVIDQINEFFRQYFGVGIIGVLVFAGRQFWKMYKELIKRSGWIPSRGKEHCDKKQV